MVGRGQGLTRCGPSPGGGGLRCPTQPSTIGSAGSDGGTLRLLYPQWQGAGTSSVRALASEFPYDVARRGYAVGSAVLEAILPRGDGPTAIVPIAMGDEGLDRVDGVEAKEVLVKQLSSALSSAADVVGVTIAEFFPRPVMHLQRILQDFPLISRC
jgi:hypothetical protein